MKQCQSIQQRCFLKPADTTKIRSAAYRESIKKDWSKWGVSKWGGYQKGGGIKMGIKMGNVKMVFNLKDKLGNRNDITMLNIGQLLSSG